MADVFIASDPRAWLRPHWARLHRQSFFPQLAPELRMEALAAAVSEESPAMAAEIRDWSPVTRRAMIDTLDQAVRERHTAKRLTLWTARKGERSIAVIGVHTVVGLDLRLLADDEMIVTHLCANHIVMHAMAARWRHKLLEHGWAMSPEV